MKKLPNLLTFAFSAFLWVAPTITVTVACQSCAWFQKATPETIFPTLQLTWPAVEEDYLRGIQDGVDDQALTIGGADALRIEGTSLGNALKKKDLPTLKLVPWEMMEPWADRGIHDKLDDAEIGPGVADSLKEQLDNFTKSINKLQSIN